MGDGDSQATGFGAHFGGAAVAGAFAGANFGLGGGFGTKQDHTGAELAVGIDDGSAVLFGEADQFRIRDLVHVGGQNEREMAGFRSIRPLEDGVSLADNKDGA